jgi:2-alkenal reductase
MERLERATRIGLASIAAFLLAVMLVLGTFTVTRATLQGDIGSLLTTEQTSSQQITADNAVAVNGAETESVATGAAPQTASAQQQGGIIDARYAAQQTGDAVVTVVNRMQQMTGRGRFGTQGVSPEALGSGVIISEEGYIVTNQHVVENQQSLSVIFADGTEVPATLVGADAYSDLAVIKVDAEVPAVAQLGDSDKLEPGQPVVAIGTALGDFQNTVTAGIVSALHRQLDDGGTATQDLIQTDAAINHGNSGGPLLDLSGTVIGINTAVVRGTGMTGDVAEGLGFAIPSNTVKSVAEQLMSSGSISRPYIGISYQSITPELAAQLSLTREQGVYVSEVAAGSPAERAGIEPNSIITKLDGVELGGDGDGATIAEVLSKHKVGDSVTLAVVAPGAETESEVTVVLGERPSGQ